MYVHNFYFKNCIKLNSISQLKPLMHLKQSVQCITFKQFRLITFLPIDISLIMAKKYDKFLIN